MWIIIYVLIGILYSYMLDMPFLRSAIKGDFEMFTVLFIIDVLVFAVTQLYNRLLKGLIKIKWYQLIIGIIVSVVAFLVTIVVMCMIAISNM